MTALPAQKEFALPQPFDDYHCLTEPRTEFEVRLASVMPMMVRQARLFLKGLKPRERAHYDLDDLLQEFQVALHEKDRYYNPKWAYTTWTMMILRQHLAELRNHCHVVDAPRDTARRLANAESNPRTTERIRRTIRDYHTFDETLSEDLSDPTGDHAKVLELAETGRQALVSGLALLENPHLAWVLKCTYGLLGQPCRSVSEQAALLRVTSARIVYLRNEAHRQLRGILERSYNSSEDNPSPARSSP